MKPAVVPRVRLADLADLKFESSFVDELPADPVLHNVPRQVADGAYTRVAPTPVAAPKLLGWSAPVTEAALRGFASASAAGLGGKDCVQLPVYWSAKPKKL